MKTPEEIKKGLECCRNVWAADHWKTCNGACPYLAEGVHCKKVLHRDAFALIQQLEVQVPCWIPVTERQPTHEEARRCSIVMERYRDVLVRKEGACYDGYSWTWYNGDYRETLEVTHWLWMPELPEPEEG